MTEQWNKYQGNVVKWTKKGFGFIEPKGGGKNIFVHVHDLANNFKYLRMVCVILCVGYLNIVHFL